MDLPASFLDRLEPGQTQRLKSRTELRNRKSCKSLHFEGGRISGKDYAAAFRKDTKKAVGSVTKFKISCVGKPSRKQIDDGPLRKLMVPLLGRKEFSERRVVF